MEGSSQQHAASGWGDYSRFCDARTTGGGGAPAARASAVGVLVVAADGGVGSLTWG